MENTKNGSSTPTQKEDTQKNLFGKDAIKKMKAIASSAETGFLCTNIKTGLPLSIRPMALQQIDDEGNVWFMDLKDSGKEAEIKKDPFTHVLFQESKHSGFLNIYGISEIVRDQAKIDELWTPAAKVWFQGGKDDPNISLIKVVPTHVHYWDNKHGDMIAFVKMAAAIVTGKTMDDGVEGKLDF
nr:pyridoxamine 5'-phosphate oxidase family protein [Pseudopedobacter sp.]